jgi:hypothetical protein
LTPPIPLRRDGARSGQIKDKESVGKLIFFRLIKNAQMKGARNPEE